MLTNSFRTRLLIAIFGCAAVAIVAGGFFTYGMVRHHLYAEFDHFLGDKVRFHRVSCFQEGKRFRFKLPETAWRRIHDPNDPEFFQFRFLDGRDVFHSYSIPDGSPGLPMIGVEIGAPQAQDCLLPNGNPGRALGVTFIPNERGEGDPLVKINLVVAHQRGDLIEALAGLRRMIYLSGSIAALLLLGATMLIVRQLLRPLESLTRQIEEAPVGEEAGAFSLAAAPRELQPVVERLNALMARVQAALDNERQFTSNAAHELRNPLAGLRSQVELALDSARDPDRDEDTFASVLEIQRQMESAVENLLVLARLESGRERIIPEPVDLPLLTKRAWKPFFDRAAERGLQLHWEIEPQLAPINSNGRLIEILFANLFDNATSYTPAGGRITVTLQLAGEQIQLEIRNTNPGVAPDDAGALFQRFHRGNETTTGQRQHAGIGLALCRLIAETLKGTIRASADHEDFQVSISLPTDLATFLKKS